MSDNRELGTRTCHACKGQTKPFFRVENAPARIEQLLTKVELTTDKSVVLEIVECTQCGLVQQISSPLHEGYYDDYDQKASSIESMADYQRTLAAELTSRFALKGANVLEIGTGDGYFAKELVALGVEVFGIEPGRPSVAANLEDGLRVQLGYFGSDTQIPSDVLIHKEYKALISRQVVSHIPDLHGFLGKARDVCESGGLLIFECPNVADALEQNRFFDFLPDYVSYLTPTSISALAVRFDLEIVEITQRRNNEYFLAVLRKPDERKVAERFKQWMEQLSEILRPHRQRNSKIAFWGAGGRGTTLLAMMGDESRDISCVFDRAETKIGKFTPGSHIPVISPNSFVGEAPDCVVVTPVNFQSEIAEHLRDELNFRGDIVGLSPWPHLLEGQNSSLSPDRR